MKKLMFLVLFAMIGLEFNSISAAADVVDTHQYVKGDKIKIGVKSYKVLDVNGDTLTISYKKKNRTFKIRKSDTIFDKNNDYLVWNPKNKNYDIDLEKYSCIDFLHMGDKIKVGVMVHGAIIGKTYRKVILVNPDSNTVFIEIQVHPLGEKRHYSTKLYQKGQPITKGISYLIPYGEKKFYLFESMYDRPGINSSLEEESKI